MCAPLSEEPMDAESMEGSEKTSTDALSLVREREDLLYLSLCVTIPA